MVQCGRHFANNAVRIGGLLELQLQSVLSVGRVLFGSVFIFRYVVDTPVNRDRKFLLSYRFARRRGHILWPSGTHFGAPVSKPFGELNRNGQVCYGD